MKENLESVPQPKSSEQELDELRGEVERLRVENSSLSKDSAKWKDVLSKKTNEITVSTGLKWEDAAAEAEKRLLKG